MEYHADRDSYICRNGRELTVTNERRSKISQRICQCKNLITEVQTVPAVLIKRNVSRETTAKAPMEKA